MVRGYPELSEHELRIRLCDVAAEHQPDRAAMLHRIARYRAVAPVADRPPAGAALRLAGSALAVATILGVGGLARWALADGPDPGGVPAPPGATTGPAATVTPRPAALRADGSIDPAGDDAHSRSDLTVRVREPMGALEVSVRVAPAAGLGALGGTHNAPGTAIRTTVVREREALIYRFTLAAGATLGAGTYVFTARYGYLGERRRDAGGDTYRVTATTAAGAAVPELDGGFS